MYKPRFKGTHYEAGYHYGNLLARKGVNIESLLKFKESQIMMGLESLKVCEKVYPEIISEIKGMANGLGVDHELFGTFIITAGANDSSIGCTTFCYKSRDDFYFVRNHDMFSYLKKVTEASVYRLENTQCFLAHGDGLIGKEDGINEHGLVVGMNFIAPKILKPGLNFFLIIRMLLEKCKTVKEAIKLLREIPSLTSHNIMLMDKTGDMAVVEMCSEELRVRKPLNGENHMISTNHFVHEDMQVYDNKPDPNWYHTKERYATVEGVLKTNLESGREIGIDLAKGKYGFVCQYDRKLGFDTLWSVSYQLSDLSIFRAEGNPSRVRYKSDSRLEWAMKKTR